MCNDGATRADATGPIRSSAARGCVGGRNFRDEQAESQQAASDFFHQKSPREFGLIRCYANEQSC
jgi:hypothetical protein